MNYSSLTTDIKPRLKDPRPKVAWAVEQLSGPVLIHNFKEWHLLVALVHGPATGLWLYSVMDDEPVRLLLKCLTCQDGSLGFSCVDLSYTGIFPYASRLLSSVTYTTIFSYSQIGIFEILQKRLMLIYFALHLHSTVLPHSPILWSYFT